jgi:hypothetical protein
MNPAPDSIVKEIEIAQAFIRLRADGIVHVHYKKNTTLDVPLQEKMREIYHEITGGIKGKFIFSADEGFIFSKEARDNAPRNNEKSPILYYALIASNLAYRIIGNFYIKVTKPKGNYKLFSNVKEAVEWLNSVN